MEAEQRTRDQRGPFGTPDGARASLEDLLDNFVTFSAEGAYHGLATRRDDLGARVIVGKKGAGKTAYLRRLQAHASDAPELYADDVQQDLPSTADVIEVCQACRDHELTEVWSAIWRRGIIRSLVSHVLNDVKLAGYVHPVDREQLRDGYRRLLTRELASPLSVASQVREIIHAHRHSQLVEYLNLPQWADLEHLLGVIVRDCPPLCFYLDGIDEFYSQAPMYWLRCQQGLFLQIMQLLRESAFGARLHIVACIRDTVFSSMLRGEHALRYRGEPHIRVLDWDVEAIRHLLGQKLRDLPAAYFPASLAPPQRSVATWLGLAEVPNLSRRVAEDIESYILRHTRLIPRDVVVIGNLLCEAIDKTRNGAPRRAGGVALDAEVVRRAVAKASHWFGSEQLSICVNQLASDQVPAHADRYSEYYVATQEYSDALKDTLVDVIRGVRTDLLPESELESLRREGVQRFGDRTDVPTVLWQNGLLGFLPEDGEPDAIFYSTGGVDDFRLPSGQARYVFHPCLIEAAGLRPGGAEPVRPFRR